jgi:antitoxin component YwqK of YwqJK toxin-antitoxin module
MKKLLIICWSLLFLSSLNAQENRQIDGLKVGPWAHKDDNGYVYAEGTYTDGTKTGLWRYYVSPVSRYTHVPDVSGNYNANGQKVGNWLFISTKTKVQVQAEFANNLMQGRCTWYNPEGALLATGQMDAGIRHGRWVFYSQGEEMTSGRYRNGLKMGDWVYDYYPEKDLHVKGVLNYDEGAKSGRLEFYKIDRHPKFGTNELLSGLGQYINGRKIGRWIEYEQGLKGELVSAGQYNRQGNRQGVWRTTLDRKNYQIALYENGVKQGAFKQYHDNGQLQYETTYQNGAPIGAFIRYYDNGNVEEKGTTIFIPNTGNLKRDTVYMELELPYEYHFRLVEERNFHLLSHNYVDWMSNPNYSVEPAELNRRYSIYLDYGLEPQRRISRLVVDDKREVRQGPYKAFFKNGKLKVEGDYYPTVTEIYDPERNATIKDFARTGKWLQYDDNGYVMRTIFYDKGNLVRMLDDKGNEMGTGIDTETAPNTEGTSIVTPPANAPAPEEEKRRVEIIRKN